MPARCRPACVARSRARVARAAPMRRGRTSAPPSDLLQQARCPPAWSRLGALGAQIDHAAQQRQAQSLVVLVELLHLAERLPQLYVDQLQRPLLILEQARQL